MPIPFHTVALGEVQYSPLDSEDAEIFAERLTAEELTTAKNICSVRISQEHRGKGLGSILLKRECEKADEQNLVLIAQAYPFEVTGTEAFDETQARLVKNFYGKAGFVHVWGGWMFRRPS